MKATIKKLNAIFPLITILILALFLISQTQGKAKIRGVVLDEETGKPINGVSVKLFSLRANAYNIPSPKTDKNGRWKALYIRGGMWNIDFEKAGYEPKKMSYRVSSQPGVRQPVIETKLRQIKGLTVTKRIVNEIKKGDILFNQKKYEEAKQLYLKLLKEFPHVFIIDKKIGNCYFAVENYEKALDYYFKVYEKQPESSDIMNRIADSYNNWGKLDDAVKWYKKIPINKIEDIDTSFNTGVLLYNSGNYEESQKYFEKAIEIDDEFADGYFQLGITYTTLNNSSEAIKTLKKFMELAPDSPKFQTARAIVDALSKNKKLP